VFDKAANIQRRNFCKLDCENKFNIEKYKLDEEKFYYTHIEYDEDNTDIWKGDITNWAIQSCALCHETCFGCQGPGKEDCLGCNAPYVLDAFMKIGNKLGSENILGEDWQFDIKNMSIQWKQEKVPCSPVEDKTIEDLKLEEQSFMEIKFYKEIYKMIKDIENDKITEGKLDIK